MRVLLDRFMITYVMINVTVVIISLLLTHRQTKAYCLLRGQTKGTIQNTVCFATLVNKKSLAIFVCLFLCCLYDGTKCTDSVTMAGGWCLILHMGR